jgi:hypothetical protein
MCVYNKSPPQYPLNIFCKCVRVCYGLRLLVVASAFCLTQLTLHTLRAGGKCVLRHLATLEQHNCTDASFNAHAIVLMLYCVCVFLFGNAKSVVWYAVYTIACTYYKIGQRCEEPRMSQRDNVFYGAPKRCDTSL